MELCFFPVPNIDEVDFGTALNKAFGTEVAVDLGMDEYKPGSTIRTYLVQYSNVYWAKKASVRGGHDDNLMEHGAGPREGRTPTCLGRHEAR